MLRGPLFIVRRYLRLQASLLSILAYISFLGPVIGVSILIFVSSIMNGFPKKVLQSIKETEASITLSHYDSKLFNYARFIKNLENRHKIKASPSGKTPIFIQFEKTKEIRGFQLKGFLPKRDKSSLKSKILEGNYKLKSGEILISTDIAREHDIKIGDSLFIHSPLKYASLIKAVQKDNTKTPEITFDLARELRVAGFYSFSYSEYDLYTVFVHLDTFNDLIDLPWGRSRAIDIWLSNPDNVDEIIEKLKQDSNFSELNYISWKEKQRGFHELVQTEKGMVLFALSFVMFAAAAGIATSILSFILKKVKDIGILKSLGISSSSISSIFLLQGTIMGTISSTIGLGIGLLMVEKRQWLLEVFELIIGRNVLPKKAYFLETLPADINNFEVAMIYITSILICIFASLVPSIIASKVKPHIAIKSD